jgi:hypothetical protein
MKKPAIFSCIGAIPQAFSLIVAEAIAKARMEETNKNNLQNLPASPWNFSF